MKKTVQYDTDTERSDLIAEHSGLYLIEERNITEGNFLVFTDVKPIEAEIEDLRLEMARGNSELFETIIMMTGGGF